MSVVARQVRPNGLSWTDFTCCNESSRMENGIGDVCGKKFCSKFIWTWLVDCVPNRRKLMMKETLWAEGEGWDQTQKCDPQVYLVSRISVQSLFWVALIGVSGHLELFCDVWLLTKKSRIIFFPISSPLGQQLRVWPELAGSRLVL